MSIKQQDKSRIVQIWGDVLDEGFTSVPNILLRYRSSLGIKSHHLALIIDIMSFKWDSENPFPSYSALAERADMTERRIMQTTQELERLNLLIRTQRFDEDTGVQITTIFDFRPLIQKLKEEMHKAEIEHKPSTTHRARTHKKEVEVHLGGEGEKYITGRVKYTSPSTLKYISPEEYTYNRNTQINKTHPNKVYSTKNEESDDLVTPQNIEEEKERVHTYFRNGIFRERLFEIYDNLHNVKLIEELVEEGVYKACKEIMINRVNELSKNNIEVNPDQIAEEVKSEFPYRKIPKTYEKARGFFVATICTLTAEKISSLLGKK